MSKKKIKIRYIIFVLIIIGIVVFVGKITKIDDLNAEKVTEIILVSPPYKKRITDRQEIEEFTSLFKKKETCIFNHQLIWLEQKSHYNNGNISIGYYFLQGKHHSEQAEICHG